MKFYILFLSEYRLVADVMDQPNVRCVHADEREPSACLLTTLRSLADALDLPLACRRRCPADGRLTMFADYVCLPSDCSRVCRLLADTTLQSLVDAMNLLMASLSGTF